MAKISKNATKKLARRILESQGQGHLGSCFLLRRKAKEQAARQFLSSCSNELQRRAVLLGAKGCWQLLKDQEVTAAKLEVLSELRQMVVEAAAKFLGRPAETLRSGSG